MNILKVKKLFNKSNGFTLIELLVVIGVMGIISTVVFLNFRTFRQEEELRLAQSELNSLLRLAQTNASTRVSCKSPSFPDRATGAKWFLRFDANSTDIYLECVLIPGETPESVRRLTLTNGITLENIEVSKGGALNDCGHSVVVGFEPLLNKGYFESLDGSNCATDADSMTITLKHAAIAGTNGMRSITVSRGGAINSE